MNKRILILSILVFSGAPAFAGAHFDTIGSDDVADQSSAVSTPAANRTIVVSTKQGIL